MVSRMPVAIGLDANEHSVPGAAEDIVEREQPESLAKSPIVRASICRSLEKLMHGLDLGAGRASAIHSFHLDEGLHHSLRVPAGPSGPLWPRR